MSGYFDAAAGLPLSPAARAALLAALDDGWADPARLYGAARRAALLLEGARDRFVYLPLGLAAILIFIGIKMLIEDLYHIPVGISLGVIVLALAAAIILSLREPPPNGPEPPEHADGTPPAAPAPQASVETSVRT